MKFAVTGGGVWMAWVDGEIHGTEHLVFRARRAVEKFGADLSSPHGAYRTFVRVIREHGGYHGLLDVAATDDDGLPLVWLPEPDADSPQQSPLPAAATPG